MEFWIGVMATILIMFQNTLALECLSLSLVLSTVVFREMPWLPKRWGCIAAEADWHVFPHRRLPNLNATMPRHCQPTNRTCRILRKQFSCPCLLLSQDLWSLLTRFSENQARLTTHLAELHPGLLITVATFSAQIPKSSFNWVTRLLEANQSNGLPIDLPSQDHLECCPSSVTGCWMLSMVLRRGKGHGLPLHGLPLSFLDFTLPAQP